MEDADAAEEEQPLDEDDGIPEAGGDAGGDEAEEGAEFEDDDRVRGRSFERSLSGKKANACALAGIFMTKAELQKGMATADGDCALGNRSVSALPLGARKLAGLVALSNDLGHDRSQRLSVKPLQAAPQPSSVERPPKSPRRPAPNTSSITATSSPEACDEGHDAEWRGRVAAPCIACSNFIACVGPAHAAGLASDAPSAHGVEIIDLEPRRRPHGRRFVLHRTCGPRSLCAVSTLICAGLQRRLLTAAMASITPWGGVCVLSGDNQYIQHGYEAAARSYLCVCVRLLVCREP